MKEGSLEVAFSLSYSLFLISYSFFLIIFLFLFQPVVY